MGGFKMMTVGELAKEANVSVRTLQYYDKINLLKPTGFSEGGRRLYNSKDMAILHQIITLKSLGFSLNDIKDRIMVVDLPSDVIRILKQQELIVAEQISKSQKVLESIKVLSVEITETNNIDWSKYAKMVSLINENNEFYWVAKLFDEYTLNSLVEGYEINKEKGVSINWWRKCCERAIELEKRGISPENKEGQDLAKEWWDTIMKFIDGKDDLFVNLVKFRDDINMWPEEYRKIQAEADAFITKSLEIYIIKNNIVVPAGLWGGE